MRIDEYFKLAIGLVCITLILYLPILFVLKKRNIEIVRQFSYLGLFFSLLLIVFLAIILFNIPFNFQPEEYVFKPIPFDRFNEEDLNVTKTIFTEIIPNIMMFIPLGIFIPIVFKKMRKVYKTALLAFLVTFSIEFFQYFIGRTSDIDDIITNILGGIIGYGIFKALDYLLEKKKWWNSFVGKD